MKMIDVVQHLKNEHDRLTKQIQAISAALVAFGASYGKQTTRRRLSAAARARIAAAQRARWAKFKGGHKENVVTMPPKKSMSAAARKKISAAQKARWAKIKAQKRSA